nr:tryptophan 7-halogenase [Sphingopyxis panaciterrulae]
MRRVIVAGAGQVGVLAAIAVKRASPATEVLVVATPLDPAAFAEHIGTALPFTNRLHDRLGIDEEALVRRAGASHRLAVRYADWAGIGNAALAAYGAASDPKLNSAFAREWGGGPRGAGSGGPAGSVGAALATAGRFMPPKGDAPSPLAEVDYALRWNAPAYRDLLIGIAAGLGVRHHPGPIAAVQADDKGGIAAVELVGAGALAADLFLDASGTAALLATGQPGRRWVDWRGALPARGLAVGAATAPRLDLTDTIALTDAGWCWEQVGRDGVTRFLAVPDGVSEAAVVAALGGAPADRFAIEAGRQAEGWIGNVVAIGDAAARFEPLGGIALDLAHRQIDLLLDLLPGRGIDPRERAEYNRRFALMADAARDWIASHYAAPEARRRFAPIEASEALARLLDQFQRHQRVPIVEEAPVATGEWAGLLHALGVQGARSALSMAEGDGPGRRAAALLERKVATALDAAPPYDAWIGHMLREG